MSRARIRKWKGSVVVKKGFKMEGEKRNEATEKG
jgi:hypothetical protein